ncbi:MAG: GNAT family N-acetyltransferase [Betaproteobacteria bacterium]|nr:GNAT family N-acetyltransferase [Betaproteobacteria bacterium]
MQTRVFLWGNFVGWGFSGIALRPGVDPTLLWPCIAEAIDRAPQLDASIRRASIQLVLDLSASDLDGGRELERFRFQALMAEPDMVLALDPGWQSFDDYRGALKAKYRKASVEMDKQLLQAGCTVEKLADTRQFAGELQALHLKVHEQSAFRFVSFPRGFIPALQENLGSDFICTVVRQGERILGFITTLIDGDTALAYVVGHDVEANRELPVYLRLLQSAIEDGIARGCKRITYGRTALEPKARLGATPVALTLYGRHKSKLMGPLLTPLLQALAPKAGPPPRNPFKETARPDRPEGVSPRPCAARTPRP